jgi:pimeloyl-ACP methyl ester carboxylesterase
VFRETGAAEVNGATIYYEVVGEGEPLVLVHAGIADSRMWEGQLTAFADRYRVLRYDMRGFGRTAMVEGTFSHHEDLRGLLDFLGLDRAHLVGCSMGGGAVLDFALEYPDRVGNLVLVGSAVGGFRPDFGPRKSGTSSSPPTRLEIWSSSPNWRSGSGSTARGDPPMTSRPPFVIWSAK